MDNNGHVIWILVFNWSIKDESGSIAQQMMFLPSWILPYMPFYKKFINLMNENMDICERHLSKAVANLTEDSETVLAKLYASCGKDSAIPLIMAMDMITAGIDTTGLLSRAVGFESHVSFSRFHSSLSPVSSGHQPRQD